MAMDLPDTQRRGAKSTGSPRTTEQQQHTNGRKRGAYEGPLEKRLTAAHPPTIDADEVRSEHSGHLNHYRYPPNGGDGTSVGRHHVTPTQWQHSVVEPCHSIKAPVNAHESGLRRRSAAAHIGRDAVTALDAADALRAGAITESRARIWSCDLPAKPFTVLHDRYNSRSRERVRSHPCRCHHSRPEQSV